MIDFFPDGGMLWSYLPIVLIIIGFIVMPVLIGGCYALLQYNMQLNSYDQLKQKQCESLGKKSFYFTLGMYGISIPSILFTVLFSNSSIGQDEYQEVNSFLHSNEIVLSSDTYVIPEDIKQQRQALYESYVEDHRLTQIEYLVLQDQVAKWVKNHLKTVKQSPDNQQAKIVMYPAVNKDNQLTL